MNPLTLDGYTLSLKTIFCNLIAVKTIIGIANYLYVYLSFSKPF